MKNILKMLTAFCLMLTAMSCRTQRQETKSSEIIKENFTETKTTYRDTIFYTPKAETSVKIPISTIVENGFKKDLKDFEKSFKPQIISQKNGNATAKVIIEKDTIKLNAECDSLALKAQIRKDIERQYTATEKKENRENKEKTGISILNLISWCGVALGVGFLLGKIIRI